MTNLMAHCLQNGDVVLTLKVHGAEGMVAYDASGGGWEEIEYTDGQRLDTLTIHTDIPEPATIFLLGLGGLIVFRKRKA